MTQSRGPVKKKGNMEPQKRTPIVKRGKQKQDLLTEQGGGGRRGDEDSEQKEKGEKAGPFRAVRNLRVQKQQKEGMTKKPNPGAAKQDGGGGGGEKWPQT